MASKYKYCVREITSKVKRDEFGPENVYEVFDSENGAIQGWVVIDNSSRSPKGICKGGTAMYPEVDLSITLRKARTMTWKQVFCVPIGQKPIYEPWGGAKGGIVHDSGAADAEKVLRAWARALAFYKVAPGKFVIPDKYIFGLDVGLKEWATKAVVEELGGNPKVSTGKPKELGGIPYDELGITGYGLVVSLKAMCPAVNLDFGNSSMSIQGFGAVGKGIVKHLLKLKKAPKIIALSDKNGAIYNSKGLNCEKALKVCEEQGSIIYYKEAEKIKLGDELFLPVDILALAYKEDRITADNAKNVKAKIVLQGANAGVTREAEDIFHKEMDILSIPDFVVNCGASIIVYVEYAGGAIKEGVSLVKNVIGNNTKLTIERSKRHGKTPREIALEIAQQEVKKAMRKKRRF